MTQPDNKIDRSEELAPQAGTTYDLIICHGDRIVFHDYYESAETRLRVCADLLTRPGVLTDALTADRAAQVGQIVRSDAGRWSTDPDVVVNVIAKMCRRWGIHVYVSTTQKGGADQAPGELYSVITEYGPGQAVAEHFPTRQARHDSLLERAARFFTRPEDIPERARTDEARLALLVTTFIMPATITLTRAGRDPGTQSYRSTC